MSVQDPRRYGVEFWLVSAVRGTGLLFGGSIVVLTCIFSYGQIRFAGFSVGAIGTSFGAAFFWSILGLIATCYFSIPLATLLTGGVRMMLGEIARARDKR